MWMSCVPVVKKQFLWQRYGQADNPRYERCAPSRLIKVRAGDVIKFAFEMSLI
jgi:hypothetical protein